MLVNNNIMSTMINYISNKKLAEVAMNQIVYVASPESQQIHAWEMSSEGDLTLLQILNTPGNGHTMVIRPQKTHLYVGIRPQFGVVTYKINKNGMLIEEAISSLPCSPTHLSTDLKGTHLYCSSYNGSCVTFSKINKHGVASEPMKIINGLNNCHSANVDTTNRVLWVSCLKEDSIRLFNIEYNGNLTSHQPNAIYCMPGSGPRHIAFHNKGDYVYSINELHSSVNIIEINTEEGIPIIRETIDIMPADFNGTRWASDIHVTSDSSRLYCCDRTANMIMGFNISKNGRTLSLIDYYHTEKQPRSFSIDASNRFLVIAGQKSNKIAVHKIDQYSGKLTMLASYAVGYGPVWVEVLHRSGS